MTTAHNFPDLDLSPISTANSSRRTFSIDSSLQITLPVELRSSEDIFSSSGNNATDARRPVAEESCVYVEENPETSMDLQISLDSVGPQPTREQSSLDNSSEEVFRHLENQVHPDLLTSRSSGNIPEEDESNVSATDGACLRGVFVYVDFQCCVESAQSVRSKLRKMGAVVTRRLSATNTHVIFSRGGRKNTLQTVLSMEKRPFLLDPHWVHACWFDLDRVSEENYNLYGCKYLLEMLKRRSSVANENQVPQTGSFIELSPDGGLEPIGNANLQGNVQRAFSSLSLSESTSELTFDQPMTATQLLSKIDKLSKRLDNLEEPGSTSPDHGVRCVSRSAIPSERPAPPKTKTASTNTVSFTPVASRPLRRRSHGAFSLAHRLPGSSSVAMMEAVREEKCAESGIRDLTNRMKSVNLNKGKVNGVDDMRKTTETNLNQIRKTLQNNSKYQKKRGVRAKPPAPSTATRHPRLQTVDESDESLLRTPRVQIRRPPVSTASDYINRLQNIPSSDEFAGNMRSRIKKTQIVFTGISKRDEKELRLQAKELSLDIGSKIDQGTRCVVSGNGLRTLSTLRAVVLGVPVVKPEWLNACEREERLVSSKNYVYEQWSRVIELRDPKCSLFSRLGKILVVDGCSPPSEELTWMIRRSGGKITSIPNQSELIVAPEFKEVTLPWDATDVNPPLIVPERYILDCITQNEVLCIADYSDLSVSIR